MLPWNCTHCGTRHRTPEDDERCTRTRRSVNRWAWGILIAIGVTCATVGIAWNQYVYGDWRCAFARCVKVSR